MAVGQDEARCRARKDQWAVFGRQAFKQTSQGVVEDMNIKRVETIVCCPSTGDKSALVEAPRFLEGLIWSTQHFSTSGLWKREDEQSNFCGWGNNFRGERKRRRRKESCGKDMRGVDSVGVRSRDKGLDSTRREFVFIELS